MQPEPKLQVIPPYDPPSVEIFDWGIIQRESLTREEILARWPDAIVPSMKTIFKFRLKDFPQRQTIDMPRGAKPLHVGDQNGVCLWAEVESENALVPHTFYVIGTGWEVPDDARHYIGTVVKSVFVWHVYEAASNRA